MATNHVEEHKRVSFGGETKQLIYDDGVNDDYSLQHASKHNTSFTSSDAPASKVKVHSGTQEVPRPISPPTQIEDFAPIATIISPPLPSLVKRMETEGIENPFRPTETLYHEVDPIVEAYRQRPFPPSPSGSPIPPHSNSATPMHYSRQEISHHEEFSSSSIKMDSSLANDTPTKGGKSKKANGRNSRQSSLAEGRTQRSSIQASTPPPSNAPLVSTGANEVIAEDLPPPNHAAIVHVDEKKKRCACCSLQ
ncbi:hypothetical protein Ddc_18596 [Ditylenchus destructor]|nr:hypothetical protein Ddc_18596 [Ditylenchus destructor]